MLKIHHSRSQEELVLFSDRLVTTVCSDIIKKAIETISTIRKQVVIGTKGQA